MPGSGGIMYDSNDYGAIDLARANEHEVINIRKTEISFITQFLHIIPRIAALDIVAEPLVERGCRRSRSQEKSGGAPARTGYTGRAI